LPPVRIGFQHFDKHPERLPNGDQEIRETSLVTPPEAEYPDLSGISEKDSSVKILVGSYMGTIVQQVTTGRQTRVGK
jgi:hypothetical protein